jgi:aspartyl-tRNA synthetase
MSFVRREDLMQMGETLVKRVLAAANVDLQHSGLSFPLPVLSYREAMNRFGSDKPDTRFAMEIHDVTEVLQPLASQLPVFVSTLQSRTGHIKCLNLKGAQDSWSKQELTSIRNAAQAQGSQVFYYYHYF